MIRVIGFLLLSALAAAAAIGVISSPFILAGYLSDAATCHARWDRSGRPVEFTFMGGCMVQRADTTWVPASALRDIGSAP